MLTFLWTSLLLQSWVLSQWRKFKQWAGTHKQTHTLSPLFFTPLCPPSSLPSPLTLRHHLSSFTPPRFAPFLQGNAVPSCLLSSVCAPLFRPHPTCSVLPSLLLPFLSACLSTHSFALLPPNGVLLLWQHRTNLLAFQYEMIACKVSYPRFLSLSFSPLIFIPSAQTHLFYGRPAGPMTWRYRPNMIHNQQQYYVWSKEEIIFSWIQQMTHTSS